MKLYRCLKCEEVIVVRNDDKKLKCCDEEMVELIPNSNDGDKNTHVPLVRRIGNLVTITVGKEPHPMVDVHHLDFVLLVTDKGTYYRKLELESVPLVDFLILNDENIICAYAYCNNHELWMNEEVTDE